MPRNWKPLAVLVDVRLGAWPVHVVGEKLFQSMPAPSSMRFPSSSWNPCAVPTAPANAATCQPTTSVAMTPIPNKNLVRLLTTVSPTHLEAAPIGEQLFAHDNSQRDCAAF